MGRMFYIDTAPTALGRVGRAVLCPPLAANECVRLVLSFRPCAMVVSISAVDYIDNIIFR